MYHLRRIKVLLATCMLACASLWAQDVKVAISKATTNSYHNGEGADKAIDGDYSTMWHSGNNGGGYSTKFPVTFTITLEQATHVDYVRYVPRTSGDNGNWDEVKVEYCSSTDGSSFVSVGTFKLNGASSTYDFYLNGDKGVTCGQVRFTIESGKGGWASAAEIEVYNLKSKAETFALYFEDDLYTELKSEVTSSNLIADADVRKLVEFMLSNEAEYKKFRVGEYKAYMTLETLRQKLGVNSYYSSFENPTGIYLKKGESCIVAVCGIGDEPVRLKMRNWLLNNESSSYPLRNGLNFITATTEGNVFVDYYTDDYKNAPNVKMHFINAPVRGYWDQETMTADDWTEILNNLPEEKDSSILVVQAKHVAVAYPVFCWKEYCPQPAQVDSLMTMYQQILWAERDMLGVEKYKIEYPNRQFSYVVKEFSGGAMAAGGEGTLTPVYSMDGVMTPDGADLWVWGIAHEFGHTNQVNPGLRWSGCIEVTNNIYSSWAELHVNNVTGYLRLEDEVMTGGEFRMRGGRMQAYFEEALRKEKPWMLHEGQDFYNETPRTEEVDEIDENGNSTGKKVTVTKRNYDHFVKLTPFWQLNLWGTKAEKCKDIIPMTVQGIRTQRSTSNFSAIYNTAGKEQMNWMKLACDSAKINLLPFFEKAGMLRPINAHIDSWNIITEEMINDLKNHVARQGYPTPTEEINYINGHNYHIYRDGLKLNVTEMHGELKGEMVTIQHSMAQNAVAFETYNINDELIRITMYGLGSDDAHSYTQVLYPSSLDPSENAAYIMAVGYDGERQRVYQTYASEDEAKYAELGRLLAGVEEALTLPGDETNTKVGYYKLSTLADLNAAYETAKAVYDNKKTSSYVAAYDKLYAEYEKVQNARIGIVEGNAYRLTSKAYPTRSMSVGANDVMVGEQTNDYDTQKWYFEGSGTEGYYYLKNKATSTYPGNVETGQPLSLDKAKEEAHAYKLQDMGNGIWALVGATGLHCSASQSYNIVGWKADADASQWYITAVEVDYNAEALHDLKSLIEKTEALIAEVESNDACNSISTVLSQAKTQVAAAKAALEAGNSSAYEALNEKYTALHDAALDVLKRKLSTLMTSTNSLIAQCGEVIYIPATPDTELALQASNPANSWYVSTNADHNTGTANPDGGGILALVDNNSDTYFHTRWGGGVINEPHYIQVDMGPGKTIKDFVFCYIARNQSPAPTAMTIYGSNDGDSFEEITSVTMSWPDYNQNETYESEIVESAKEYRYLRFTVTESNGPGTEQYGEQYFFGMREFDIIEKAKPESYSVELGAAAGDVTEDILLAAFKQNQEAQASYDMATTVAQLQKAIDKLQAQYNALYEAKNVLDKSDWDGLVNNLRELINECSKYQNSVYVTEELLNEIEEDLSIAQTQCDNATTWDAYNEAKKTLQGAKDKLSSAMSSADEEAEERVTLLGELSELISTANSLIADCGEIVDGVVKSMNPNGRATEEQLLAVYNAVNEAKVLDNTCANATISGMTTELQEVYNILWNARNNLQLPVVLTTDVENPVLYVINSKRGGDKVLQYDPADNHMFSIASASDNKVKQVFYFTVGDTRTQVYVHPFAAGEQVLAASNTDNGAGKVFAAEKEEETSRQWTFVKRTVDNATWYNLQLVVGTSTTYFSNFGGGAAKMGFYSYSPDSDSGSLFSFTSASIEGSAAYHSLNVYYAEAAKVESSEIQGGTAVGYYPEAAADAYNTAYSNAANVLEDAMATDEDYTNAYNALKAANEALNLIMPKEGKYYRFVSADTQNGRVDGVVYADPADNKMYWSKEKAQSDATAIWTIAPVGDGTFHITNLHTGTSISSFISNKPSPLSNTPDAASFVSLSADGQVKVICNGTMHAQGGGSVVTWNTDANDASAWRIVEVENMSLVNFTLSMSTYEHAGLYLNYAVKIPSNVDAYYIAGNDIDIDADGVGTLKLTKIADGVIPACTGVILNAPKGDYTFEYVESDATIDNLLTGSAYTQYCAAEDNHSYYSFGQSGGQVGLYKNSVKYVYDDEQGTYVETTEGATHYRVSANKVLFDWDASSQGVTSFRFRIGDDETGIDGITIGADTIIYDLYGRRIMEVVTPGLYIINGEKRYINIK